MAIEHLEKVTAERPHQSNVVGAFVWAHRKLWAREAMVAEVRNEAVASMRSKWAIVYIMIVAGLIWFGREHDIGWISLIGYGLAVWGVAFYIDAWFVSFQSGMRLEEIRWHLWDVQFHWIEYGGSEDQIYGLRKCWRADDRDIDIDCDEYRFWWRHVKDWFALRLHDC